MKNFRLGRGPQYVASGLALTGLLLTVGLVEDLPTDTTPVEIKYAGDELLSNADVCQEDRPCWDCETMGNLLCGALSQPQSSYLDAYNWCDATFGDETDEAIDCQTAALEEWYPDWRERSPLTIDT